LLFLSFFLLLAFCCATYTRLQTQGPSNYKCVIKVFGEKFDRQILKQYPDPRQGESCLIPGIADIISIYIKEVPGCGPARPGRWNDE